MNLQVLLRLQPGHQESNEFNYLLIVFRVGFDCFIDPLHKLFDLYRLLRIFIVFLCFLFTLFLGFGSFEHLSIPHREQSKILWTLIDCLLVKFDRTVGVYELYHMGEWPVLLSLDKQFRGSNRVEPEYSILGFQG